MKGSSLEKSVIDYSSNRKIYAALALKIKEILQENLEDSCINYLNIEFRAKSVDSLKNKLERKIKKDSSYSIDEVHDLAGIRVIAYVRSDLDLIRPIIKENFEIKVYKDKTEDLGVEKVGYRSEHFIATLPSNRLLLPEYKKFSGLVFEIQLRTILEHSWAEIEHDRRYKYSGVLPDNLERRFSLLSAVLELADNEFDNISQSIDNYATEVLQKAKSGNFDIPIDSTSLKQYLDEKFKELFPIIEGIRFDHHSKGLIRELNDMGINTLKKLDEVVPEDYAEKLLDMKIPTNYSGIIRDILIIAFKREYFEKAWKESWDGIGEDTISLYEYYDVGIDAIIHEYGLQVIPEE
ncbi:hypothetical protein [uncultured Methanolobus sp.]|uniref:GTP pyrophosphokinase n=1 Tax=uncultured Methanolobus sp. TaxID=218300 RepID=UPI002AAAD11A|nr:hypothetical protein [uncultured Methanolobus sp.]